MKPGARLLVCLACAWGAGVVCEGHLGATVAAWAAAACAVLACTAVAALVPAAALPGVAAAAAVFALRRREIAVLAALFAGGAASAAARSQAATGAAVVAALDPGPDGGPRGEPPIFEGVVARPVERGGGWRRVHIDVDGVVAAGGLIATRWRGAVTDRQDAVLLPGDRVRFRGVPRVPVGYANPGAFDRARHWQAQGVDALVSATAPGIVRGVEGVEGNAWMLRGELPSAWRYAAWARERARRAILGPGPGPGPGPGSGFAFADGRALVAALVIGERNAVPPRIEEAFRATGVSHVLSVSGLHLAAVALLLFQIARAIWLRRPRLAARFSADRAAALIAAPIAVLYTMMTGAETATVRALAATLVALGGAALGRRVDGWTALAVAALAILAHSPWSVYDPSFQLSFAAAAALLAAARLTAAAGASGESRRRRALRWMWRLVVASALATIATAPITALHFGVIQPAGVVTNLVVVPLAELIVLPLGLAGAFLGSIWPPIGFPFVEAASGIAAGLAWLVERAATISPVIDVPPPTGLHYAAIAAIFAAFAWLRSRWRATATLAVVALAAITIIADHRRPAREGVTVTFLDVGQGDSAVIEVPGETWLIDAGGRLFDSSGTDPRAADPGEQAVWPFLRARGVTRLDLVVVSHPHPDHYGGLAALARHLPIGEVWINGDDPHDPRWDALLADLAARGARIVTRRPGETREHAGAHLIPLAPDQAAAARSVNDNSLVLRLEYAGRSILFTGDIEREGEAALPAAALAHADVVKVPHHGSRTSSSPALVAATSPAIAVVSCGRRNRFGFPAPAVVARWQAATARVLRTDRDGAVTIRIAPRGALGVECHVSPCRD